MMTGEQIEGTILVDNARQPNRGMYFAGTTLAPRSDGYSDGIYVEVDFGGEIVYACHRDGDNGPRTWWFAGTGTMADEASQVWSERASEGERAVPTCIDCGGELDWDTLDLRCGPCDQTRRCPICHRAHDSDDCVGSYLESLQ